MWVRADWPDLSGLGFRTRSVERLDRFADGREDINVTLEIRRRAPDMRDEKRRTCSSGDVGDQRDVESIPAPKHIEPEVHVALCIESSGAHETEGIARELDRVEPRLAIGDGELDFGRVKCRFSRRSRSFGRWNTQVGHGIQKRREP